VPILAVLIPKNDRFCSVIRPSRECRYASATTQCGFVGVLATASTFRRQTFTHLPYSQSLRQWWLVPGENPDS